ncbi:hypothetical protein VTO42DRAFT_1985 [Malbranchea cinnamomea]
MGTTSIATEKRHVMSSKLESRTSLMPANDVNCDEKEIPVVLVLLSSAVANFDQMRLLGQSLRNQAWPYCHSDGPNHWSKRMLQC